MSGVPVTINGLPGLGYDNADKIPVWDTSAGITGAYSLAQVETALNALYALLAGANNFTANQNIAKVDPTLTLTPTSGKGALTIVSADAGASWGGNVSLGRNTNASTAAAGFVGFTGRAGANNYVWVDQTGVMRVNSSLPTSANDTAGTVIGSQTSSLDAKEVYEGDELELPAVLEAIAIGAAAVRAFSYKGRTVTNEEGEEIDVPGQYAGEIFEGLITDYAPRYGVDRDEEHPAGRSLNTITVIGDLLRAVDYLAGRVAALEAARA